MVTLGYVFTDNDNSLPSKHEHQAYLLYLGNLNRRNNKASWWGNNSSHHEVCDAGHHISNKFSVFAFTSCFCAEIVNYFSYQKIIGCLDTCIIKLIIWISSISIKRLKRNSYIGQQVFQQFSLFFWLLYSTLYGMTSTVLKGILE